MKTHYLLLLAAAGAATLPAQAQNHPNTPEESDVVIVIGSNPKAEEDITNVFIENAPKSHKTALPPRFAIVGKDNKFYLGIGGSLKATMSYDFGNPIDNGADFTTSAIPMTPAPGNGGLFQVNAQATSVFLNLVAMPGSDNKVGAYINFNLTGNNYLPSLQHAYLTYRGFTAGYTFSLFTDAAACPATIDNEGPNALTAIPNGVFDYAVSFLKNFKVGVGVEMPIASFTTGHETTSVNQRVPDIPAYIQYSWGGGSNWLRFSAIMRNMTYRDNLLGKNHTNTAGGIKLSGSTDVGLSALRLYYQAAYGKGITSYFQDLYEGGLDMVPDEAEPGKLKDVEAWGGYLGLQYNFSPNVFASCTYSYVRTYADQYANGSTPWGEQYRYAQYLAANVFWNIKPYLTWGLEYDYGQRKNYSGLTRHDNRVQTMLQVNF